ncbi:hypothetical protein PCANC_26711 [Puccinia coronata f. sp. avenae]|uniref:Uncharacterized protein n=1 Tax=Puccinia coronata f. sp. avenae TaxID=200324 RepID=A0A2N5S915_9BASI|nr:hypothetical protein PCANC_26711 [Puccinia coronata f. sp. avenae]
MNALNPHAMITPESLPVDPLNYLLPLSIMPDEEAAIPLSKDVVTPADGVVPPAKSGLPLASSHSPQAPTQSPNPGSTAHPPPPTVVPGTLQRCGHTKEVKSDPNITLSVLLLMKTSQDTMAKWTVEEKSWNETSCQEEQAWARQLEEKRQQDKDLNRANTMLPSMMSQPCPTSPAGLQEDSQPCLTGGRTGTVQPKQEPTGRTDLSNRSQLVLCNRSQELIGQACTNRWQVLRSDSACPTTGQTRLFEHRSNCRVQPVNAGSAVKNFHLGGHPAIRCDQPATFTQPNMCCNSTRQSQGHACCDSKQSLNCLRANPYSTPGSNNSRQSSVRTKNMAMAVGIPDKGDQEVTEVLDQDLLMFAQQPDAISPKLGHVEGAHELFPHAKGDHKPIPPMGGTHKQPPLAGGQGKIPVDTNNKHTIPQEACGQGWHPPPSQSTRTRFSQS